ncbi:MAG: glycerol-3-phosphate 1-O-acyltransferase PlsY [Candidatus Latescibacteria bacterium]|nr:glycerol-3-phosphate 1-O-acyltransferase PlsY [Candidatus Latescibacterota bacterium]
MTSVLLGFLLGGIPSGLWIGQYRGVDLRLVGSRNTGATNAFRTLGAKWGVIVFLLDAAKGTLAAVAPGFLLAMVPGLLAAPASGLVAGAAGAGVPGAAPFIATVAGGLAAIVGHVFSPWLRFRGGRGVATSLGVFLAIIPIPTLLAFAAWIVLVALSRRVSVGSLGASILYPFLVLLTERNDPDRTALLVASTAVAVLVIARHRANIGRLLSGTEPPLVGGKAGGPR